MLTIADKIRKGRESVIEVKGHKITIRRPTTADIASRPDSTDTRDHLRYWIQFAVDWDLQGIDLYPGGTADPEPYSAEAFYEWVSDFDPEDWKLVVDPIRDAYLKHKEKAATEAKN